MRPVIPELSDLHKLPLTQQPSYEDPAQAAVIVEQLRKLPPLVFAGECDNLKSQLAEVAAGKAFLLQGGD